MHDTRTKIAAALLTTAIACGMCGCSLAPGGSEGPSTVTVKSEGASHGFDHSATIEETTLIDDPAFTIVADQLDFRNDKAYLELTMTNKTDQKIKMYAGTWGFSGNFINDYMVTSGYLSCELEPGETKNDEARFNVEELKIFGMDAIREIGLGVSVSYNESGDDLGSMNYDKIYTGILSIPTSAYDENATEENTYQRTMSDPAFRIASDVEVKSFSTDTSFSKNGISIRSIALIKNTDGNTCLLVELKNDTQEPVNIDAGDIQINGTMAYEGPWTRDTTAPGKTAVMDIILEDAVDDEVAESIDMSSISSIGIELSATDLDNNQIIEPTVLEFDF